MTLTRPCTVVALSASLLSCAPAAPPAEPIERSRTVAAAPDEVRARIDGELRRLGFAAGADGGWGRPTGAPEAWAQCGTIVTSGGETGSQREQARPRARAATVSVTITPTAAGTQVGVATSFEATYHHRFRNLPFTAPCASTGELERTLLAAAG
jgi:hypothetical protein